MDELIDPLIDYTIALNPFVCPSPGSMQVDEGAGLVTLMRLNPFSIGYIALEGPLFDNKLNALNVVSFVRSAGPNMPSVFVHFRNREERKFAMEACGEDTYDLEVGWLMQRERESPDRSVIESIADRPRTAASDGQDSHRCLRIR